MRTFIFSLLLSFATLLGAAEAIEVWKSPDCSCCGAWVDRLKAAGFDVKVNNVDDIDAARRRNGVPQALGACHTARAGGYAIEGHVPAADIKRLLKERPKAAGLAVPGMPLGSPGMESPDGRAHAYEVLLFDAKGRSATYGAYKAR
jgi:hypothetical protein